MFIEADSHSGSNGAAVSEVDDNSGKERNFTGSGTYPTVKTNAVNGKKSFVFTRSTNPLTWSGSPFKLCCGYIVLKINSLQNYDGFLTANNYPTVIANHGNNSYWNNFEPYFHLRVNDRVYRLNAEVNENPPLILNEWQILFFNYLTPVTVSSLQIGQDRGFTDRKSDMEIAAVALYSDWFIGDNGEQDLRKNYESFAHSYQIAIENVFPFYASINDTGERDAITISDGQREPIQSQKSAPFWTRDINATIRSRQEFRKAREFYDAHAYSTKTFLFRQFTDTVFDEIYRFEKSNKFQDKGNLSASVRNYGYTITQSDKLPAKYIPSKPNFSGAPVVDTIPPSNVTGVVASNVQSLQADYGWNAATDNIAITGYLIQRAENSAFTGQIAITSVGNVTTYRDKTIVPDRTYYIRVKAHDAQPNYSVNWSNVYSFTTPAIPDTANPTVSLAAPPSTVSGTQILSATATDTESGVHRVEFYITPQSGTPSRKLGEQTSPTVSGGNIYEFEWDTTVDALGNAIADGVYTLSAIAYDNASPRNMSSPSFRPNITVANTANAIPTLSPLVLTSGDLEITADLDFADADGTVEKVYLEISADGTSPNSPKGTNDWETVLDGVTPDTATTHSVVITEFDGNALAEGETIHFRAWVEDNDGAISTRRFDNAATNPPVPSGGSDFAQTDDIGSGSDFIMTDFGDFVTTD